MEIHLNDAKATEPGSVLVMPRNQITFLVCTWLYSKHTENTAVSYSDILSIIQGPDTDKPRHIKQKLI